MLLGSPGGGFGFFIGRLGLPQEAVRKFGLKGCVFRDLSLQHGSGRLGIGRGAAAGCPWRNAGGL